MTANDYLKSIQRDFDGIEKNLDMLSKKEIDTMLNALAEGEDFDEEQPELISRRAAIDAADIADYTGLSIEDVKKVTDEHIRLMPSIQPVTGKWIEKDGYDGDTYYDCSVCGESWTTIDGTPWDNGMKYCPNCGAKMEVSE